ncbi:hypothetical protein D3C72_1813010 [compost metagenome]
MDSSGRLSPLRLSGTLPSPRKLAVSAIAAQRGRLSSMPCSPTMGAERNTRSNIIRSRVAAIRLASPPME